MNMHAKARPALETLMEELFDYAGMFPPAALSFEEALSRSAKLPTELKRQKLLASDLVLSLENLSKLNSESVAAAGFDPARAIKICALGSSLKTRQELISEQRLDELRQLQAFNAERAADPIALRVSSYEFKLEAPLQSDQHAVQIALRNIKSFLSDDQIRICVEPDLSGEDWEAVLDKCSHVFSDLNLHSRGPEVVFKVRGSGPSAVNNHKLLRVVERVAHFNLNLKATAGLHHPIIEKELYQNSLGFLNLSAALFLKRALGPSFPDIEALDCLFAVDTKFFTLGTSLGWKDYKISLEQLKDLKRQFPFSIGSCSLHEPDQDLARLFSSP